MSSKRPHSQADLSPVRKRNGWVEQGTFTLLVFTTTGGMADECKRYHSRLAEFISFKKGEDYMTWIRSKVSFTLPRSYAYEVRAQKDKSL